VLGTLLEHLGKVQAQRWQAVFSALWPMYLGGALLFVGPLLGAAQAMTPGASIGALYLRGLAGSLGTAALVLGALLGFPFVVAGLGLEARWDRLKRRLPLVSRPLRQLTASRFVLGLGLANASGLEVVRSLRLAVKATGSPSVAEALPPVEGMLRRGSTLTAAVEGLGLLDRSSLGALAVAETTGTLAAALEHLSVELQESSLRASRVLMVVVLLLVTGVVLVKIVAAVLGTLLGPVKSYYEAIG
jgi:type II secretory pathway component PulF